MSADKKKASGGSGCSDGASLARGGSPHADGASSGISKTADSTIDNNSHSADGQRPRARNQDVLPGILGKQLRAAYGELLNAPVPDQFTDLIKRLESKEAAAKTASPGKPPGEESGQ